MNPNLLALAEALRKRRAETQLMESIEKIPPANKSVLHIVPAPQNLPVPNPNAPSWKEQFPGNTSTQTALQNLRERIRNQSNNAITFNESADKNETDIGVDVSPAILTESTDNQSTSETTRTDISRDSGETTTDKYGNQITYNDKQLEFIRIAAIEHQSAVLIGAAGTGKTTCQKGVVQSIIDSGYAGEIDSTDHKHLIPGTPGIVVCAYTRRAVANIRKNVSANMQNNCITIHKLLEYQPVYYTVQDERTGEEKTKMVFEATRNADKPLPDSIKVIIFEESSMLGTDLYKEVINACPHNPQLIFLGDIQQLPPVFGPAILGFKLLELPVVELTEVYRQALESPIISLAHRILSGNGIPIEEFSKWKIPKQLNIRPWKKKIDAQNALATIINMFVGVPNKSTGLFQAGEYDPEEDMILIPFNKQFGTDEINKGIANHLAHSRSEYVYEIVAGFNKIYLSPNDKVLYDKEDATVLKIETNPAYSGVSPSVHSTTMDYWGHDPVMHGSSTDGMDVDFLLGQMAVNSSEDRVNQSSHIVTLKMNDSDQIIRLQNAGDLNSLLLGYALTVHKAQGSEWRKVFLLFHQSHATMMQRELLYTAVTRAREELFIVCEPETFVKGIQSQRVKGDTLAEKAEHFKGKIEQGFVL